MIRFSYLNLTAKPPLLTNHSQAANDFNGVLHLTPGLILLGLAGIPVVLAASVKHPLMFTGERDEAAIASPIQVAQ